MNLQEIRNAIAELEGIRGQLDEFEQISIDRALHCLRHYAFDNKEIKHNE